MKAGELVTAKRHPGMLKAQGLAKRGMLPGDMVYIHTGWGERWQDPDTEKAYYARRRASRTTPRSSWPQRRIVAICLDTPFIDTVPEGMLAGKAGPARRHAAGDAVRRPPPHALAGRHPPIENAKLDEIAARQGLDLVHHGPAAARKGRGRLGDAPGRDRRAGETAGAPR